MTRAFLPCPAAPRSASWGERMDLERRQKPGLAILPVMGSHKAAGHPLDPRGLPLETRSLSLATCLKA